MSGIYRSQTSQALAFQQIAIEVATICNSFTTQAGWSVSPQAQLIIQEGIKSIENDRYGIPSANSQERYAAAQRTVAALPGFLNELHSIALATILTSSAPATPEEEQGDSTIGGILLLQNIHRLALISNCYCWPR